MMFSLWLSVLMLMSGDKSGAIRGRSPKSVLWPAAFFRLRCHVHHLALACIVIVALGVVLLGWPLWVLVASGAVLIALVADGMARPGSSLFYPTLSHGRRDRRRVALSFDDGPDAEITPQVLELLAAAQAHATFFVIGRALAAQPQLARRMLAEGHVLGNHSWRHARWQNFCSSGWHARELERAEQVLAAVTGNARTPLYRPPVGLKSGELGWALGQRGVVLVAWSLHSRDTRARSPERIARRVLAKIRAGDIVLLHDGHDRAGRHRPLCVPALRLILQGLRELNLECVTVPELLGLAGPRTGLESQQSAGAALPESAESLP